MKKIDGSYTRLLGLALFLLPFLALVYITIHHLEEEVGFEEKELAGSRYTSTLFDFMIEAQKYRGLVYNNAIDSGDKNFQQDLRNINKKLALKIEKIDVLDKEHNRLLNIGPRWNFIKSDISDLQKKSSKMDAENFFFDASNIIHSANELILHIADTSNLILDPYIKRYYLMNITINIIPQLTEYIGKARGKISGNLENFDVKKRNEDALIYASLQNSYKALSRSVDIALKNNPDIRKELINSYRKSVSSHREFIDIINNPKSRKEVFDKGTEAISAYVDLYKTCTKQLDKMLLRSIASNNNLIAYSIIFSLIVLAASIALYIFLSKITSQKINISKIMEEQFGGLFNNNLTEIFIFDEETLSFINVNETAQENIGYSIEELKNMYPYSIKPEVPTREKFLEFVEPLTSGKVNRLEFNTKHKRKDGTLYDAEIRLQMYNYGGQKVFLAIILDVTEKQAAIKQIEQVSDELRENNKELIIAKEKAEESARLKSDFLASMSHEIRTPMNGIFGMAELLLNSELTKRQEKHATTLMSSAESLLVLIDDILDFSKIEAGKLELDPIAMDLETLIYDITNLLSLKAQEKHIELLMNYEEGAPTVFKADPVRIKQIIINLVGNAIKFTEEGHVVINVEVISDPSITEDKKMIKVTVEDTGIGIDESAREKIFEKFSQADGSTTRTYGGTGLGLAICKQLTEMMGGEIGVESELEKGTKFWFTMLLEKSNETIKRKDENYDISILKGLRALIVDDLEINDLILTGWMENFGMECDTCRSSKEALLKFSEATREGKHYDFCIIDYMMPEINGHTLGRIFDSDETITETVFIMMSAYGEVEREEELKNSGFSAFLPKPVKKQKLAKILAQSREKFLETRNLIGEEKFFIHRKLKKTEVSFKGAKILIAEDNRVNQEFIIEILDGLGCTIEVANNGQEAVNIAKKKDFDLIFMDCQMPILDGFKASEELNLAMVSKEIKEIPIVALTANAMKGDKQRCFDAGMKDYLSKPVRKKEIVEVLKKWLPINVSKKNYADEPPVLEEDTENPSMSYSDVRVLAVDDNRTNLMLAVGLLEELGCKYIETAINGEIAVEKVKKHEFDLIIMDCQMPVMDGYDATKNIRKLIDEGKIKDTVVVALTANAMEGDREKCINAGMHDYFTKPVRMDDIKTMIKRWVFGGEGNIKEEKEEDEPAPAISNDDDDIFDIESFENAKKTMKDKFPSMVSYYIEDTTQYIDDLKKAIRDKDMEAIRSKAHAIKSSSFQIGAKKVSTTAKEIEDISRAGEFDESEINLLYDSIAKDFEETKSRLEV